MVFLLRAERGGGGCARSAQTEGALVCFADQPLGAFLREAFAVVETDHQPAEHGPAALRRAAGAGGGAVGSEVAGAGAEAGDLASAEIDEQVQLRVGVGERGCDGGAVIRVVRHQTERFLVLEESEACCEDVDEVRLHRHDGAEAPEDPEDDLRQLVHGRSIAWGRLGGGWWLRIQQWFSGWALILRGKILSVGVWIPRSSGPPQTHPPRRRGDITIS